MQRNVDYSRVETRGGASERERERGEGGREGPDTQREIGQREIVTDIYK